MPELCTLKYVLTLSGEQVAIRTRELVPENDPRLPTKEEGYVRFNADQPPPKPVEGVQSPPMESSGEAAMESASPLPQPCLAENAVQIQVPASPGLVDHAIPTFSDRNLEPRQEIRKMSKADEYNDNDYEDSYEDDGLDEEEDDDRPPEITRQTLKEIDSMSPPNWKS